MTITRYRAVACLTVAGMIALAGASYGQQDPGYDDNQPRRTQDDRSGSQNPNWDNQQNRDDARSRRQLDDQTQWDESDRNTDRRQATRQYDERDFGDRNQNQNDQNAGLGVTVINTDQGVLVRQVMSNSPASQAGIQQGDEIVAVDNRQVRRNDDLINLVRQFDPGEQVEIRIVRNGQERVVQATLESRREALNIASNNSQDDRFAPSARFYRGGSSPPWGSDDLRQHVDQLERQVQAMQRELQDLRAMLDDDPSQRQFAASGARGSQDFRSSSDQSRMRNSNQDQYDSSRENRDTNRNRNQQQYDNRQFDDRQPNDRDRN